MYLDDCLLGFLPSYLIAFLCTEPQHLHPFIGNVVIQVAQPLYPAYHLDGVQLLHLSIHIEYDWLMAQTFPCRLVQLQRWKVSPHSLSITSAEYGCHELAHEECLAVFLMSSDCLYATKRCERDTSILKQEPWLRIGECVVQPVGTQVVFHGFHLLQ